MSLEIHSYDRDQFHKCRLKWHISSPWRLNRTVMPSDEHMPVHFWLGNAIHYALEDWHGHNYYKDVTMAFRAYAFAYKDANLPRPIGVSEAYTLGLKMLGNYRRFTETKKLKEFKTYWKNGQPQVEVPLAAQIPVGDKTIVHSMTFDRVVEDENKDLWVMDYKTYQRFSQGCFERDIQFMSYYLAANAYYPDKRIAGVIVLELRKAAPDYPSITQKGEVSVNKNQNTTYYMYLAACKAVYGSVQDIPQAQLETLGVFAEKETDLGDHYIRMTLVQFPQGFKYGVARALTSDLNNMLREDVEIYPAPSRECSSCDFFGLCTNWFCADNLSDWEKDVIDSTYPRNPTKEQFEWRNHLMPLTELQERVQSMKKQHQELNQSQEEPEDLDPTIEFE